MTITIEDLESANVDQLREWARDLEVAGRSSMNRDQLIEALTIVVDETEPDPTDASSEGEEPSSDSGASEDGSSSSEEDQEDEPPEVIPDPVSPYTLGSAFVPPVKFQNMEIEGIRDTINTFTGASAVPLYESPFKIRYYLYALLDAVYRSIPQPAWGLVWPSIDMTLEETDE